MRLDFPWRDDGRNEYCPTCHAETVSRVSEDFLCSTCGWRGERRIVIDPGASWWVGDDGEYWHESAGVFVRDGGGRFLFVERAVYPVGELTVPAGHVDAHESPEEAALRELHEEIGWEAPRIEHFATEDIIGDSCRRGSDAHRWHAYCADFDSLRGVRLSGEGRSAHWLTLAEALTRNLTFPVRHVIERHKGSASRCGDADP